MNTFSANNGMSYYKLSLFFGQWQVLWSFFYEDAVNYKPGVIISLASNDNMAMLMCMFVLHFLSKYMFQILFLLVKVFVFSLLDSFYKWCSFSGESVWQRSTMTSYLKNTVLPTLVATKRIRYWRYFISLWEHKSNHFHYFIIGFTDRKKSTPYHLRDHFLTKTGRVNGH